MIRFISCKLCESQAHSACAVNLLFEPILRHQSRRTCCCILCISQILLFTQSRFSIHFALCAAICRAQVYGAISGPQLGEAAHRLLKNTLQIKSSSRPGLLEAPQWDSPSSYKQRPAGPVGYEGGFILETNHYHHSNHYSRGSSSSRPFPYNSDNHNSSRQHYRAERPPYPQDHSYELRTRTSNLTLDDGPKVQPHELAPSVGFWQNQQPPLQNSRPPPPFPPMNWIDRQPYRGGFNGGPRHPVMAPRGVFDKQQQQATKVYRIRSPSPPVDP